MTEKYEPSAFPWYTEKGMTLRDYFAIHATEEDLKKYFPKTVGETRDILISEGIIPSNRIKLDAFCSYNSNEYRKLRSLARYQFADDMIEMRNKEKK